VKTSKSSKTISFGSWKTEGWKTIKTGVWLVDHKALPKDKDYMKVQMYADGSWSNTYGERGSISYTCNVWLSKIKPYALWIPKDADRGILAIAYKWYVDGMFVRGRKYISANVLGMAFKGAIFSDIKGLLGIAKPDFDKYAISYREVYITELERGGISDSVKIVPETEWGVVDSASYHELAVVVYSKSVKGGKLSCRLKLVDWATVSSKSGWIYLIVKDLQSGNVNVYVQRASPYTTFSVSLPAKYEVWAVGVAEGYNDVIYSNLKYARILLAKSS